VQLDLGTSFESTCEEPVSVVLGGANVSRCALLQFINAAISFYETTKAADAVAALKKSLKPKATVKRDGKWAVSLAHFLQKLTHLRQ
jgi:hypothetical protein